MPPAHTGEGLKKVHRSRLAQLDGEQRGVGAVGTGSGVTRESAGTAKLFSCNPETDSCGKSHLPPPPAKHSLSDNAYNLIAMYCLNPYKQHEIK